MAYMITFGHYIFNNTRHMGIKLSYRHIKADNLFNRCLNAQELETKKDSYYFRSLQVKQLFILK
jgi:hypothetical protein